LDYPFHFIGHDKRAPPTSLSECDCRVTLSTMKMFNLNRVRVFIKWVGEMVFCCGVGVFGQQRPGYNGI